MDWQTSSSDIRWWFWASTLAFIVAALALQVLFFLAQERSLAAFPTQIRLAYFGFTLFGLWPELRWFVFAVLLLGTVRVTFFGRCAIALVLKRMPWNRGREVRLN